MATIIPINLSFPVSQVLRLISLFPAVPPLQTTFFNDSLIFVSPSNYVRDVSFISTGFPHSLDLPVELVDQDGVFSVPQNTYSFVDASFLEPKQAVGKYSILLIDVGVAPLEPGLSKLRIDYIDNNQNTVTEYLDMPFWSKLDAHPSSIEEIKDYAEEVIHLLQEEIDVLNKQADFALNHLQLSGLAVSGQVYATQATDTQPNNQNQAHNFVLEDLDKAFNAYQKEYVERRTDTSKILPGYMITSTPNTVYPGRAFTVTTSVSPNIGDVLTINNFTLTTSASGNSLSATLPNSFNINYTFNLNITNKGKVQTPSVPLTIKALPIIDDILPGAFNNFATFNDLIQVFGKNFGDVQGSITFDGVSITPESWSDQVISFILPENSLSGKGVITTIDNNSVDYTLYIAQSTNTFEVIPVIELLQQGQQVQYSALYNNNPVSVNWSLEDNLRNIGYGTLNQGTITQDGLFTAPNNVSQPYALGVVANYVVNSKAYYAKASLTVSPVSSTLTISPSSTSLEPSFTQPFVITNSGTPVTSGVDFYLNGILNGDVTTGFIDRNNFLYQAPSNVPRNQTINIEAVYQGQSAFASIRIVPVGTINNVGSKEIEFDKSTPDYTKISTYRNIAYQSSVVSGLAYTAISGNDTFFYGNPSPSNIGNNNPNFALGMKIYLGQAKDVNQRSYLIGLVGYDVANPINGVAFDGVVSYLQLTANNGAFIDGNSNPPKVAVQFFSTLSSLPNSPPIAPQQIQTSGSFSEASATQIYLQANNPAVNGSSQAVFTGITSGNEGLPTAVVNLNNGYYVAEPTLPNQQMGLSGYPSGEPVAGTYIGAPYGLGAYDNNIYAPLNINTTYDMINDGTTVFYRFIAPLTQGTTSISIDNVQEFDAVIETSTIHSASNTAQLSDVLGAIVRYGVNQSNFSNVLNITSTVPPFPQITSVSSGNPNTDICPGQVINVYGKYFSQDSQVYFANSNNNILLPRATSPGNPSTTDNVNYVISVTVPSSIPATPANYTIKIVGSTGTSNQDVSFAIGTDCIIYPLEIIVTPANEVLNVNTSQQYTATFQNSHGVLSNVTNSVIWYVNGIQGGNSTYGFINSSGFYFVPGAVPVSNPVSISATYTFNSQPIQGSTSATIRPLYNGPPPPAPPLIHHGCYMLRVSPDTATTIVPGGPLVFTAELYIDDANPQPVYAQWSVNGVPGGSDTLGTIDTTGTYFPPANGYPTLDFPYVKIEANYTTTPVAPDTTPLNLTGYSVLGFTPEQQTSSLCLIRVTEQINVFFADGRCGYIPAGTNITATPGQYIVATYTEKLNVFLLPFDDGSGDQNLPLSLLATQANNLNNTLYNEGTITKVSGNSTIEDFSNIFTQPYTVVLGVCDPNNGLFQSMWDLVPVVYASGSAGTIPTQPNNCVISHSLELVEKSLPVEKTLVDGITERLSVQNIVVSKSIEQVWTGEFITNGSNISIDEPLTLYIMNLSDNTSCTIFELHKGQWDLTQGDLIFKDGRLSIESEYDVSTTLIASYKNEFFSPHEYIVFKASDDTIALQDDGFKVGNVVFSFGKSINSSENNIFDQNNYNQNEHTLGIAFHKD